MRAVNFHALGVFLAFHYAGLYHDVLLVVNYSVEFLRRKSEKITYLVWQRTEIPDMGNRHNQLDVSCTLAAHFLFGNLHAATVADYTFISNALILSAGALVVLGRTENTLAEQAVALRLVSTVVYGLRLCHLAIRIFKDFLRRRKADGNLRKITLYLRIFLESHMSYVYLLCKEFSCQSRVMLKPSPRSSCSSTLSDSGMPGVGIGSPFTIAS